MDERPPHEGELVTVARAARALHLRKSLAAEWLRTNKLVVTVAGRERVIWGDVLRVIRGGGPPAPRPSFRGLPRERL